MTTKISPAVDTMIDITSTARLILPQLEKDLTARGEHLSTARRELNAIEATYAALDARIDTIRSATATLAAVEPQIATLQAWLDFLTTSRRALCDELLALPSPIRFAPDLGKQQNLMFSVTSIDRGPTGADNGYTLEMLRLGALMREAGVSWRGSLPDSERRLTALQQQRDDARGRLDEALLGDAERAQRQAEHAARAAVLNARPQRKTRDDGSQYDRYPDGRMVEVTS